MVIDCIRECECRQTYECSRMRMPVPWRGEDLMAAIEPLCAPELLDNEGPVREMIINVLAAAKADSTKRLTLNVMMTMATPTKRTSAEEQLPTAGVLSKVRSALKRRRLSGVAQRWDFGVCVPVRKIEAQFEANA